MKKLSRLLFELAFFLCGIAACLVALFFGILIGNAVIALLEDVL